MAGALLQIRADWAEMTSRFGVANWSTAAHPFYLCTCNRTSMVDRQNLTHNAQGASPLRTEQGYDEACSGCEIQVPTDALSPEQWAALLDSLSMDLRKEGSKGLSLTRAWPTLGLRKGDRFEPSAAALDWQMLYAKKPALMTFWRTSSEGAVRHRNPMFAGELGSTLVQSYVVDTMHVWCLGLFQQYVCNAMWKVIESSIFDDDPVRQRLDLARSGEGIDGT